MAHDIMNKDSMFSVGEVPWHGLGQVASIHGIEPMGRVRTPFKRWSGGQASSTTSTIDLRNGHVE